ncbi:hypothetical protein DCAR_0416606 [Daucus carota subsp. sativus]|uniref:Uncharacterized protein n=1 Tax=Daucus carota subsp. sativus TaxID=79200 RepID=A0A162AB96_DAUCS|nr:PREDICTED: uncharacterized protein LOC108217958 [Daucus carota subsp. sativus]WOG97266.1 hypothetical protein DCAR_0416606 [Daucus carota subsp. sativus]
MGIIGDFRPIIWELKAEGLVSSSKPALPHIMYVDAPENSELRIVVTDFKYSTWMAVKSVIQLENMKVNIGYGGEFSSFIEYVGTSLKSRDTKIVFEGQSIEDGPAYAKLVGQESKEMPLVCFHLNKLVGAAAVEAAGNVSQELFKEYKSKHESLVKEQERLYHLSEARTAERRKSDDLQKALDMIMHPKRLKTKHMNERSTSDSLSVSTLQQTQAVGKEADVSKESTTVSNNVVPAHHREKLPEISPQNIILIDDDDDDK